MRYFIRFLIVFILFFIFTATAPSAEWEKGESHTIPVPAMLENRENIEWLKIFRQEVANNYENSFLMPASLDMMADIMTDQDFPADPHQAAELYFGLARNLDLQLKQGTSANRARMLTRKTWQQVQTTEKTEKKERTIKPGTKAETTELFIQQEKQKDKVKIKIKDEKEKKEKLIILQKEKPTPKPKPEKTDKPDKTPKPTKTPKPIKTPKP